MSNGNHNQFCNNCGKTGHSYNQCPNPITSLGIITFNKHKTLLKYLLICRKDSLGYVEFVRGKYPLYDKDYIQNIINEMTIQEKNNLLTKSFEEIWEDLWGDFYGTQYRTEEKNAKDKFNQIKEGIHRFDDTIFNLESLIKNSNTDWIEPEWGFPKGRRNHGETDLHCAIREFCEETGIHKNKFSVIKNIIPYDEIFTGSNFKSYKHKYYIANSEYTENSDYQKSEVSKLKWMSLNEAIKTIRPYNLERIEILKKVDKVLHKYSLIL